MHSRNTGHRLWLILMPGHAWLRTCAGRQRSQRFVRACTLQLGASDSFIRHIVRSDFRDAGHPLRRAPGPSVRRTPVRGSRFADPRFYISPFDDHTLTQGRDQSSRALRGSSLNPRSRTPVPERFARETASRVSCFVCLRSRVICDICKHSIVRSRLRRHALNMMRVRGAPGLRVPVRYRSNDNRQTTPVTGRHSPRDAASARRRGVRARRPRPPPRTGGRERVHRTGSGRRARAGRNTIPPNARAATPRRTPWREHRAGARIAATEAACTRSKMHNMWEVRMGGGRLGGQLPIHRRELHPLGTALARGSR